MIDFDTVHVIDNIIPFSYQEAIRTRLFARDFGWGYVHSVASLRSTHPTPAAVKPLFTKDAGGLREFDFLEPIIYMAADKIGYNIKEVLQARTFLHFPLNSKIRPPHDSIHRDFPDDHLVILYYVNDSDGPTLLFPNKNVNSSMSQFIDDRNPSHSVEPKQGRVVIFNGQRLHCSTAPVKGMRCIINFDVR